MALQTTKKKSTTVKQISVIPKLYMTNPFTKQRFFLGDETKVVLDSWVDSQINAELLIVK